MHEIHTVWLFSGDNKVTTFRRGYVVIKQSQNYMRVKPVTLIQLKGTEPGFID